jgi:hypothetical protein
LPFNLYFSLNSIFPLIFFPALLSEFTLPRILIYTIPSMLRITPPFSISFITNSIIQSSIASIDISISHNSHNSNTSYSNNSINPILSLPISFSLEVSYLIIHLFLYLVVSICINYSYLYINP